MQGKELHYFHGIIERDLGRLVSQHQPLTRHYVHTFNQDLCDEVEMTKANITMAALNYRDQNGLPGYIQACQKTILILASHLVEHVNPSRFFRESRKLDHTIICKRLYVSLEDLLRFIESHYSEYIDKKSWIPKRYVQLLSMDVQESIRVVDGGLSRLGVDDELKKLTLSPFQSISTNEEVSYQRIQYVRELKKALLHFISEEHKSVNEELMALLFRSNYNSMAYSDYNFMLIRRQLGEEGDHLAQLERLALLKKIVRQTPLKSGVAFDDDLPSIKDVVSEWIEDEIEYLTIFIRSQQPGGYDISADEHFEKFQINLPSEEILFICYLYVELGVLDKNRVTDLVKGLSRLTSTKRKANLSWSSLRKKFYNAESRTVNSVGVLLREMQKIVDKLRGLK